jgi:hypothetical protein
MASFQTKDAFLTTKKCTINSVDCGVFFTLGSKRLTIPASRWYEEEIPPYHCVAKSVGVDKIITNSAPQG